VEERHSREVADLIIKPAKETS